MKKSEQRESFFSFQGRIKSFRYFFVALSSTRKHVAVEREEKKQSKMKIQKGRSKSKHEKLMVFYDFGMKFLTVERRRKTGIF